MVRSEERADLEDADEVIFSWNDSGDAVRVDPAEGLRRGREQFRAGGNNVAGAVDEQADAVGACEFRIGGGRSLGEEFGGGFENQAALAGGRLLGNEAEAAFEVQGGDDLAAQVDEAANKTGGTIDGADLRMAQDFADPEKVAGEGASTGIEEQEGIGGFHGRGLMESVGGGKGGRTNSISRRVPPRV